MSCDLSDLADLPLALRAAWHEAQAHPDRSGEILARLSDEVRRLSALTDLRLRAAKEQVAAAEAAADRATARAERRSRKDRKDLSEIVLDAIGDGFDPHGYFVYCLWGFGRDHPLYVGLSRNVLSRLGTHLGGLRRRNSIERVTLIRCETESAMVATEARLIREHQPPWNTVGIIDKEGATWRAEIRKPERSSHVLRPTVHGRRQPIDRPAPSQPAKQCSTDSSAR